MGSIHANTISMTHQSGLQYQERADEAFSTWSVGVRGPVLATWMIPCDFWSTPRHGIKPTPSQDPKVGPAKKSFFFRGTVNHQQPVRVYPATIGPPMTPGSGLNPRTYVIGRAVGGCGGLGCWHQRSGRVAEIPLLAVRDGDLTEGFVFFCFSCFFVCRDVEIDVWRTRTYAYDMLFAQHATCSNPFLPPQNSSPSIGSWKNPDKTIWATAFIWLNGE